MVYTRGDINNDGDISRQQAYKRKRKKGEEQTFFPLCIAFDRVPSLAVLLLFLPLLPL